MESFAQVFRERFSTGALADAAFRTDSPVSVSAPGLYLLDPECRPAGPVVTVEAENDLVSILEAVHGAEPGDVVTVSNRSKAAGLIGDLIGAEAVRRGLGGFVVDG